MNWSLRRITRGAIYRKIFSGNTAKDKKDRGEFLKDGDIKNLSVLRNGDKLI
jgi:hypothetical protein